MKSNISLLFIMLLMITSLIGCSSDSTNSSDSGQTKEVTQSVTNQSAKDAIVEVTAITEVYGDGQKVSAVVVHYNTKISTADLSIDDYSVEGKTIEAVYANTEAAIANQGVDGEYVIIKLDTDYVVNTYSDGPSASHDTESSDSANTDLTTDERPTGMPSGDMSAEAVQKAEGFQDLGSQEANNLMASVTQRQDIKAVDRAVITADAEVIASDNTVNLLVDDFVNEVYTDESYSNKTLMYNLYVPENYDASQSYPIVLFMPDATATGSNTYLTLTQGLGAVIWTTEEEQEKHACFVLAPQYTEAMTTDTFESNDYLDMTVDLLRYIMSEYSIDTNRVYNTGQSGGCMAAIAMDVKYPDLFAASLLVAGQWDPEVVDVMAEDNLWIVVSEGDEKAYPGMNAITAKLETLGAKVSSAVWDAKGSEEEFAEDVSAMLAEGSNINYTQFINGSVIQEGQTDNAASEHINTWRIAYTIEGIRDWLFAQTKSE